MNKKSISLIALSLTGIIALAASLSIAISNKSDTNIEVKAITPPSSLTYKSSPTNGGSINLNDTSEANIRSYYSSINSLPNSERRGTNLLKNLKPILQKMYYYSYSAAWQMYEITDRDWNLSPASSDNYNGTSYNAATNSYSAYYYGSSASSQGNNPHVRTLYRTRDASGSIIESGRIREWGSHSSSGTNREHVWCQSRGFKDTTGAEGPAGTDIHHLMSGDGYVNQSVHNNNPYGNVDKTKSYTVGSSEYNNHNYLGFSSSQPGVSTKVFEPQDCDKGDIARALFYMEACYNNYAGATGAISAYNPFLKLTNTIYTDDTVSSTDTTPATMGILSDLLEWHKLDPVDEFEIHRNNLIYENYQANRNPFIDYPEWVDYVWGDKSTSGVASPASDVINGYKEEATILTISDTSITVLNGNTTSIEATTSNPSLTINWSSNDEAIVSIVNSQTVSGESTATLRAKRVGEAIITASDGISTATCEVEVLPNTIYVSSVSISGPSTMYDGEQQAYSATVLPNDASNKIVQWISSNTMVATIDSLGVLTAISVGSTTITARAVDGSNVSDTLVVTIESRPESGAYSLVNSVSELKAGSKVVIAAKDYDLAMGSVQDTNNRKGVAITKSGNSISWDEASAVCEFTLGGTIDAWTFYDDTASNRGYIYSASSSNNYLKTQSTLNDNGRWTISFNSGVISLVSNGTNSHNVMRYNSSNNNKLFSSYLPTSTTADIALYQLKTIEPPTAFASLFLANVTCDNGLTPPSTTKWNMMASEFALLETEQKNMLKSANADEDGTIIEQCVARYDYIIVKYGSSEYQNFMNRATTSFTNLDSPIELTNKSTVSIVVILLSVAMCGTTLILFKRKHH